MSLIPRFFPRARFDLDNWFRPSLDLFDPFDELDRTFSRNMFWLTRPSLFEPFPSLWESKPPEKYRINVDCAGYSPKSLTVEYKHGNLHVNGREEVKTGDNDYSIKEFKKSYKLPDNAEIEKLVSFYAGGQLVIEVPLKNEQSSLAISQELCPQIIDGRDGSKQVALKCSVPKGIDPSKITVTCKDRDLIIKAEDKIEKSDGVSSSFYYKRCRLPENADLNALTCSFENNHLAINAPVRNISEIRHIAVQHK